MNVNSDIFRNDANMAWRQNTIVDNRRKIRSSTKTSTSASLRGSSQKSKTLLHKIPWLYQICSASDKNIHISRMKTIIIIFVTTIFASIIPQIINIIRF